MSWTVHEVGARHASSWREPFAARVGAERARGRVGAASLSIVQPRLLGVLGPVRRGVLAGLRRDAPVTMHATTLVSFDDATALRRDLEIANRLVGYVALVASTAPTPSVWGAKCERPYRERATE